MADDHSRIDELRRRVDKDPASIAFASLAEELRKAGEHDEAVRVCRAGLERHPTYLSARVTLGRALLALQQYGEARTEIEYVLHAAPDNLLALKCMSELEAHPIEAAPEPSAFAPSELRRDGPHVEPIPEPPKPNLRIGAAPVPATVEPPAPSFVPPTQSGDGGPVAQAAPEPARVQAEPAPPNGGPPPEHPAIAELEDWQARIQADRARRAGNDPQN